MRIGTDQERIVQPIEETEASWVPDYFGDDYLRLYQFPEERTQPENAFLITHLTELIPQDGRILDLACGQGRHAIGLAAHGYHVTGLDYQANLLQVADERARAQGVEIVWVRGDMRALPFTGCFDAVLNLFTAFGYFSDAVNASVLDEVVRALRPGGVFIIDIANRDALIRQAQPRSWKRLPDGTLVINEWQWDVRTGRYTHWQLLINGEEQRRFTHSVRVYTCTELCGMLENSGLTVDAVYGGFHDEELTLDAPRLICIGRKPRS